MRLKEKKTLSDYLLFYFSFVFIIIAVFMIIGITIFSDTALFMDIEARLIRSHTYYAGKVEYENNQLVTPNDFLTKDLQKIKRVIMDEYGNDILGHNPVEIKEGISFHVGKINKVIYNNKTYYYYDRMITLVDNKDYHTKTVRFRSYLNKEEVKNSLAGVREVAYGCIPVFLIASFICLYYVVYKMKEPVNQLFEMSEYVAKSQDFSKRIEIDEDTFCEVQSLVEANNNLLTKAERLIDIQRQFSSDVAHELKTPMTVITAECQYARKYLANSNEMKEALDVIESQAKKTNNIVTRLFQLTRLEQNEIDLEVEYLDLSEIVNMVCNSETLLEKKNITLKRNISSCYTMVDLNLIMIAFRNILNNAAKYSPDGSEIIISLYKDKESEVIRFICQDYGSGIEEKNLNSIFYRFYRLDNSRNSEGLGLGLSITKKIVEIHHGNISVESKFGEGSKFFIELPIKKKD